MSRTVHLAVYDKLADWETGHAIAHIMKPDWQRRPGRYQVRTVGASADPITTMGGVSIVPDLTLADLNPTESAMLILPGADSWTPDGSGDTAGFARLAGDFLDAGVPVAAICGATLGLAAAGLLNDRDHTSGAAEFLTMAPAYSGGARYQNEPAVTDRGLITAGPAFPVHFARAIFDELELYSPAVSEAWFGLYSTGDPQWFHRLMVEAEKEWAGA